MTTRMVFCKKLGKELAGLEKVPFSGEIGEKIFEHISEEAWAAWQNIQLKIINEYRLNMGDKDDYQTLIQQMLLFLNLNDA